MHARLVELISYLDRQQSELEATLRNIPDEDRSEPPGRGRWSVVDVLEHLTLVERRLASRFDTWFADARAKGVRPEQDNSPILPSINTARTLDRSSSITASESVRPKGQVTPDAAWQSFKAAREDVKRVVATADGLALSEISYPHPALGPLNLYEWIAFVGSHAARHGAQIVEIGTELAARRRWTAVDKYISSQIVPSDPALDAALAASTAAGLPDIQVTPAQGKLLHLYARMIGARAILEVGTLGGYSTIWLASALPADGRLITLEIDPKHADVARSNIARAELSAKVEVKLGKAIDSLPHITGPFDLVFIDADKPSNADYFNWAVRLTRPGGVIIVDNVVRNGEVIDDASQDPNVLGVRRLNAVIAGDPRVTATTIQTVGAKGYDGFTMAIRNL